MPVFCATTVSACGFDCDWRARRLAETGRDDRHPQLILQRFVVHRADDHGRRLGGERLDRLHDVIHFLQLER